MQLRLFDSRLLMCTVDCLLPTDIDLTLIITLQVMFELYLIKTRSSTSVEI
jgi:hypothetical protein